MRRSLCKVLCKISRRKREKVTNEQQNSTTVDTKSIFFSRYLNYYYQWPRLYRRSTFQCNSRDRKFQIQKKISQIAFVGGQHFSAIPGIENSKYKKKSAKLHYSFPYRKWIRENRVIVVVWFIAFLLDMFLSIWIWFWYAILCLHWDQFSL